MDELRKKHREILALYKLEKGIRDIYVEGNSDKVFIDNYLKNKGCNKKVIPISIIDFSELPIDYFEGLDVNSNRNKVIVLSKLLNENLPQTEVKCIVDKDFDDYIKSINNSKLLKTDFSCLESYLFCEQVIDKFLKIGIRNFPVNGAFVLSQLSKVLKSLFCVRLLRELNFRSAQLVDFDRNLKINKLDAKINFNEIEYLEKFISKNDFTKDSQKIMEAYNELKQKLTLEIRHHIHGHDFLSIFFLYINKIKNTSKYKEENFDRTLFLTVETPMIENLQLFKSLIL
ncbi:MAG: hypothetical protein JWN83_1916 [Chitinophagaceae bacterium]|nr:hypothetical protein [Chitinophagaceae bacterium]